MTAVGVTGNNCFPEAPDITVNETIVTFDEAEALFVEDIFTTAGTAFTLSQSPFSNAAVSVYKQGSLGRVTVDYSLSDTALTLTEALVTGEVLVVKYMQALEA